MCVWDLFHCSGNASVASRCSQKLSLLTVPGRARVEISSSRSAVRPCFTALPHSAQGFERSGLSLALKGAKSVALAPSIAASLGGRSLGANSAVSFWSLLGAFLIRVRPEQNCC